MSKTFTRLALVVIGMGVILNMATPSYAQDATKKLGRGLVNILTGWIELPKNIYETVTFPFPLPQEYKPILEPEYVLEKSK